jgi:hypothetical protein
MVHHQNVKIKKGNLDMLFRNTNGVNCNTHIMKTRTDTGTAVPLSAEPKHIGRVRKRDCSMGGICPNASIGKITGIFQF